MTLLRLEAVFTATVDSFKKITLGSASWEGRKINSEVIGGLDEWENTEGKNGNKVPERALVGDGTRDSSGLRAVGFE